MDCNNINLKRGSSGSQVKELQTALKAFGYYTKALDGDFGTYTEQAVKNYQKKNNLIVDGWVGTVTCKKLNQTNNGVYISTPHYLSKGCNQLGQCTSYYCAPHALRQCLKKLGITSYNENTLAGYAGTTKGGTSHQGIETAIAKVCTKENIQINMKWINFSDLGNTTAERFKKLGELLKDKNTDAIIHNLYRNKYGHYEVLEQININTKKCKVLNSLGNKCSSSSYCGYVENRGFIDFSQYIRNITQKSILLLTRKK